MPHRPRSPWALGVMGSATPFVVLGCLFPWVAVSPAHDGPVPWAYAPTMQAGFQAVDWLVLGTFAVGWIALALAPSAHDELVVVSLLGASVGTVTGILADPGQFDALYPTGDAVVVPGPGLFLLVAVAGYLLIGGLAGLVAGERPVDPEDVRCEEVRS